MNSQSPSSGTNRFSRYLSRPLTGWTYLWQGFLLCALKYNLDRLIASAGFHRNWFLWNYVEPIQGGSAPASEPGFYLTLLLTSLPFLVIGLLLTLRRLRTVGLAPFFCLLFFVPVANVLFFLILSAISSHVETEVEVPPSEVPQPPEAPEQWPRLRSALGSIVIVGLAGTVLVVIGVKTMHDYGWGLFVALPFALGLTSSLLYARRHPRSVRDCLVVAILPLAFVGAALLAIAFEGLVCLLMASPVAVALAALGGFVGHAIQETRRANARVLSALALLSIPLLMGMESRADLEPPLLRVTSSVVIDAPPEKVWPNVVAFSPIPERRGWLFHTGIAYPTHAVIDGQGVGAVRHCVFSTGEFVEPIETWDAPRLLKFSVAAQPEPLEELSPYPHIEPAHLHGYMMSKEGQLRLIPLDGGRTRLEGTTWYENHIWPVAYWQLWTDFIIHRIHLRVLDHIKELSEA